MPLVMVVGHLKSKLLSYPTTSGQGARFQPRDEGERARYSGYALYRRTAEAITARAAFDQALTGHPNVLLVGDGPVARRSAADSDHAPLVAHLNR